MLKIRLLLITVLSAFLLTHGALFAQSELPGNWKTDTSQSLIDLDELKKGGPPKDGIPSIDDPEVVSGEEAGRWISDAEPVIALSVNGTARAYPLQIMIWHEIVNEKIGDKELLVTFCPLCYSAIVFDRVVNGEVLEFGVSGFLRHSDMIMFDRKTESLWQQFTGKAIVGDYVGTVLEQIPSQIISFSQFRKNYPEGRVLSKNTGYNRPYGRNPYSGYDDVNRTPFTENDTGKIPPMEKVIGVKVGEETRAYRYTLTEEERVINDTLNDTPIVVFHLKGAQSALDAPELSESKESGSTGAFKRVVGDKMLTFKYKSGKVKDNETGSEWSVTGKAIDGPLEGEQLAPVVSGDYFAFAWLVFWPETALYGDN